MSNTPSNASERGIKTPQPWYEELYFGLKSFTDLLAALFIALNNFVYYANKLKTASRWISIPFLAFITAVSLTIQALESISFYRRTHQAEEEEEEEITHKVIKSSSNWFSRCLAWMEKKLETFITWCSEYKKGKYEEIQEWEIFGKNPYKIWEKCAQKPWYKATRFTLNISVAVVVSYTIFVSKSKSMHTLLAAVATNFLGLPTIVGLTFFASCVYSAKNLLRTLHAIGDEDKKNKPKSQNNTEQTSGNQDNVQKPKANIFVRGWCAMSLFLSPFIKNIVDGYTALLLIQLVIPSYVQTTLALAIGIGAAGLFSDLHNNWILYWQHFYHHKMSQGMRIWNNILTLFDRIGNTTRLFFALEHTDKPAAAKNFLLATSIGRSYLEVLRRDYVNGKHSKAESPRKKQCPPEPSMAGATISPK